MDLWSKGLGRLVLDLRLAEHIAQTRRELARVEVEDLRPAMERLLAGAGLSRDDLTPDERRDLLQHLAEVHDRIDHKDLAYAEELLERRRGEGVDSVNSGTGAGLVPMLVS